MHRIIRTKAYEAKHGPHFDEEHARKAVSKMENEDGSRGQHLFIIQKFSELLRMELLLVTLMQTTEQVITTVVANKKGGNYVSFL